MNVVATIDLARIGGGLLGGVAPPNGTVWPIWYGGNGPGHAPGAPVNHDPRLPIWPITGPQAPGRAHTLGGQA